MIIETIEITFFLKIIITFYIIKLIWDLLILLIKKDFKILKELKNKKTSIFYEKSLNEKSYTILDSFLDIIYIFKKIPSLKTWESLWYFFKFIFLWCIFFLTFLILGSFFFFFFIFCLSTIFCSILWGLISNRTIIWHLKTYKTKIDFYNLIKNIAITPLYWAKVFTYSILGIKKKKFEYYALESLILSKIAGSPLWVFRSSLIWTSNFLSFLETDEFSRKKKKIWPSLILEKFKETFKYTLTHKFLWEHIKTQNNKIIVRDRKINLNPNKLEILIEKHKKLAQLSLNFIPYVVNLNGVNHQVLENKGVCYTFTSQELIEISYFDGEEKKEEITTKLLTLHNKRQYFSKSFINLENFEHSKGYYRKFLDKNNLNDIEALAGFYLRMSLERTFGQSDYLWYQDKRGEEYVHAYYKFENKFFNYGIRESINENEIQEILKTEENEKNLSPILKKLTKVKTNTIKEFSIEKLENEKMIENSMWELYGTENKEILKYLINEEKKESFNELIKNLKEIYKDSNII